MADLIAGVLLGFITLLKMKIRMEATMNLNITYGVISLMVGIRVLGSSLILQGPSYDKTYSSPRNTQGSSTPPLPTD